MSISSKANLDLIGKHPGSIESIIMHVLLTLRQPHAFVFDRVGALDLLSVQEKEVVEHLGDFQAVWSGSGA